MSGDNIIELGPHERMTPEEALAIATGEKWDDVIICGFHLPSDDYDGTLVVRSSRMNREFALWIAEHLRFYATGRL